MILRAATPADIPGLLAMFNAPGNLDKLDGYDADDLRRAMGDADCVFFCADHAETLAGFIWLTGVAQGDGRAKIEEFAAALPGHGVGTHLMRGVMDWAAQQGKSLWLNVAADNHRAIQFYERFGFRLTHVRPAAWARRTGDIADAATMEGPA